MSMIPKRLLATAALGAALAITGIGETRAMQIPVTTANAIASPAMTEQVQWRAATAGAAGGAAAGGAATAGAATAGVVVDGVVAPWRQALSRAG